MKSHYSGGEIPFRVLQSKITKILFLDRSNAAPIEMRSVEQSQSHSIPLTGAQTGGNKASAKRSDWRSPIVPKRTIKLQKGRTGEVVLMKGEQSGNEISRDDHLNHSKGKISIYDGSNNFKVQKPVYRGSVFISKLNFNLVDEGEISKPPKPRTKRKTETKQRPISTSSIKNRNEEMDKLNKYQIIKSIKIEITKKKNLTIGDSGVSNKDEPEILLKNRNRKGARRHKRSGSEVFEDERREIQSPLSPSIDFGHWRSKNEEGDTDRRSKQRRTEESRKAMDEEREDSLPSKQSLAEFGFFKSTFQKPIEEEQSKDLPPDTPHHPEKQASASKNPYFNTSEQKKQTALFQTPPQMNTAEENVKERRLIEDESLENSIEESRQLNEHISLDEAKDETNKAEVQETEYKMELRRSIKKDDRIMPLPAFRQDRKSVRFAEVPHFREAQHPTNQQDSRKGFNDQRAQSASIKDSMIESQKGHSELEVLTTPQPVKLNGNSMMRSPYRKKPGMRESKVVVKPFGEIKAFAVNSYAGVVRNYNEDRVTILVNAQDR